MHTSRAIWTVRSRLPAHDGSTSTAWNDVAPSVTLPRIMYPLRILAASRRARFHSDAILGLVISPLQANENWQAGASATPW